MIPGAVRGRLPGESRMPSPAGVAPTNTTPGGAHPFGTAAAPLRPPRVERLMFRCKPSTAGVVWLIAAPAFSLSRECRPACHADHFDAVSLPSDRSLPIRYPEVRACMQFDQNRHAFMLGGAAA